MNSKEQMIKDYEKIINFVLKKMCLSYRRDELFDIGMIGFVQGINTFNEKKGFTYMTYLYDCIQNEIGKYLNYEKRPKRQAEIVSLNSLVGESKDTELIDFFGYDPKFDDNIYFDEIIKKILVYLNEHFTNRQEEIFKFIYGLDGYPILNYEQIAKIYKTSKQSIYASHQTILKRLKTFFEKERRNDKDNWQI